MAKEKPNIILILTDDLGYGDLSCFNPESKIRTEHIDAVAAGGLRNTDCHASSALCTPSRYGLLTGRYNWRSRLKRGVLPASLDQPPFVYIENDHVLTPPDHMIGVRRLDCVGPSQQTEVEYGPAAPGHDPAKVVPDMDAKVLSLVDDYAGNGQPFFIYYPTPAVHGPLLPAPEYQGKSGISRYGDFVLQVDGFVGKLDAKLHEKGIADDTILIFTSDNGCSGIDLVEWQ